jgi:uncharacterized Zn finger protein
VAEFTRTWWGNRFLLALSAFTDPARLGRGRAYARNGRIVDHTIANGKITAKVRGSINPYFGVYKEPLYTTTIAVRHISAANWSKVVARIAANARQVTQLLMNEVPDTIEAVFEELGEHLLPRSAKDFTTTCSCPDFYNPCKHVAGVCHLLAGELDEDPFLLFELRGLSRDQLRKELEQSPLGQLLASELTPREEPLLTVQSYYTRPTSEPVPAAGLKEFWTGARRLPPAEPAARSSVPALQVKKQGDFPPFWHKDASFIDVMEDVYERVRTKSPQMKQ